MAPEAHVLEVTIRMVDDPDPLASPQMQLKSCGLEIAAG